MKELLSELFTLAILCVMFYAILMMADAQAKEIGSAGILPDNYKEPEILTRFRHRFFTISMYEPVTRAECESYFEDSWYNLIIGNAARNPFRWEDCHRLFKK